MRATTRRVVEVLDLIVSSLTPEIVAKAGDGKVAKIDHNDFKYALKALLRASGKVSSDIIDSILAKVDGRTASINAVQNDAEAAAIKRICDEIIRCGLSAQQICDELKRRDLTPDSTFLRTGVAPD